MEGLGSLITEESNIEVVKATVNEVQGAELKEEITADKTGVKVNGLKIKSIEVEGKYGTYIKGSEGVKTGDKVYKDITDLEREKDTTQEEMKADREALNNKLSEIQCSLKRLNEKEKEELEMFAEIEAVFEM